MLWRMMWFFFVAAVISYAAYLVAGSIVTAQESGAYEPILIRDELAPGRHYLSGMVMVASPCDQLALRTETLSSSTYMLLFKTWHEPSVPCSEHQTPRTFHATLFAPAAGVEFGATLDGAGLPIVVIPVIRGR